MLHNTASKGIKRFAAVKENKLTLVEGPGALKGGRAGAEACHAGHVVLCSDDLVGRHDLRQAVPGHDVHLSLQQ